MLLIAGCGQSNPPATLTREIRGAKQESSSSKHSQVVRNESPAETPGSQLQNAESRPDEPGNQTEIAQPDPQNIATRKKGIDWPDFLGPNRDSKSPERGILTNWNEKPPKIVWKKDLGVSYDIGSVSRGRYYQYDRYGDVCRLYCLNAETGEQLWEFEHPTRYVDFFGYNGGPRASPVIDGDRVYIFSVDGWLHCLNAFDGTLIWKMNTSQKFGVVQNFFGVGSTPLVEGDLLLMMVGGSPPESHRAPPRALDLVTGDGSGIVAFDKKTGEVKYKITDELASYASLRAATLHGRRQVFAFLRGGLVAFEPEQGSIDFHYPWRAKILESVNASTPVIVDDEVLISECYGVGSSLLKVTKEGYDVVWKDDPRQRERSLETHWNTPIYHEGYLYGSSGRHSDEAELRCLDWKTGKVMWSKPGLDRCSLLYVDGHFICQGEYGEIRLIKVNPEKYEEVAKLELRENPEEPPPLNFAPPALLKYPCWSAPILSHGLLYVRGDNKLVCLELIEE